MCCAENQGFIPEGKADPVPEQAGPWGAEPRSSEEGPDLCLSAEPHFPPKAMC